MFPFRQTFPFKYSQLKLLSRCHHTWGPPGVHPRPGPVLSVHANITPPAKLFGSKTTVTQMTHRFILQLNLLTWINSNHLRPKQEVLVHNSSSPARHQLIQIQDNHKDWSAVPHQACSGPSDHPIQASHRSLALSYKPEATLRSCVWNNLPLPVKAPF